MKTTRQENMNALRHGFHDGIPIGLGYFAVAFTLGIAMRNAGLSWLDGFALSVLEVASAGEYAATQVILNVGTYVEMAVMTLVANARYLLMSTALSQKLSPETKMKDRLLIGYAVTDELFGIAIAQPGYLNPWYYYGAVLASVPAWAIGTSLGIIMGDILPVRIVSALSVALYGMFIAIIIPPSRKDRTILILVIIGFLTSYLSEILPWISTMSSGTRIIILTIIIASIAAYLKPVKPEEHA